MKNFLFDLTASQPNVDGDFHGGGKYAKKVFFALADVKTKGWTIYGLYDSAKVLDEEIKKGAGETGIQLVDLKGKSILTVIKELNISRAYSALPSDELIAAKTDCEVYGTVHGLRFMESEMGLDGLDYFPGLMSKSKQLARMIFDKVAKKRYTRYYERRIKDMTVLTVSNHTKYSIMSYFPQVNKKITAFYSPDVTEFEDSDITEPEPFDQKNYFLLVSGNRWLKNNLRSAIALDQLFTDYEHIKQHVIITGVSDPDIFLKHIKNKSRFIFHKYVRESFLKVLYENAYAFIYMSLNEGFGYPPLEAMKRGIPVITSPFTSIPEICGDAVIYSNPYSINEIKNRILQIGDAAEYNKLVKSGIKRYELIKARQDDDLNKMTDFLLA
jgi:glycosyltransferase involved in cell wall biosynthesis